MPNGGKEQLGYVRSAMANFGHISYGETIIAQTFVPNTNSDGCKPYTKNMFSREG